MTESNRRGKRGKADYTQVTGFVPKRLALALRAVCAANEITQSEALEEMIDTWLKIKGISIDALIMQNTDVSQFNPSKET